mgnify:CR=1 FL=1
MSPRASARFDEARKRRVGYELSLVLSGHVAGKLRQSVGAAEIPRIAALAACQHGSRPEQLSRVLKCHRRFNAGNRKNQERSMTNEITRRDALALGVSAAALAATGASARDRIDHQGRRRARADASDRKRRQPADAARRCGSCKPDEDVFRANAAKFTEKTGVEVKVDFVGWEDINQQTAVTSNTGAGPDIIIGFSDAPHIYADKLIELTDVADYLGKRYGGWLALAAEIRQDAHKSNTWIGLPFGAARRPADLSQIGRCRQSATTRFRTITPAYLELLQEAAEGRQARRASRSATRSATATALPTGCCGRTMPRCWTRRQGHHQQQGDDRRARNI